jgi:hypothetical protein
MPREPNEAAVGAMMAFVWSRRFGGSLPENFAGFSIEAEEVEAIFDQWTSASARALSAGRRRSRGGCADRDGGREKNPIAPDRRCRVSSSRDFSLPFYVCGVAPGGWPIAAGHAVEERSTPLRPVRGSLSLRNCRKNRSEQKG